MEDLTSDIFKNFGISERIFDLKNETKEVYIIRQEKIKKNFSEGAIYKIPSSMVYMPICKAKDDMEMEIYDECDQEYAVLGEQIEEKQIISNNYQSSYSIPKANVSFKNNDYISENNYTTFPERREKNSIFQNYNDFESHNNQRVNYRGVNSFRNNSGLNFNSSAANLFYIPKNLSNFSTASKISYHSIPEVINKGTTMENIALSLKSPAMPFLNPDNCENHINYNSLNLEYNKNQKFPLVNKNTNANFHFDIKKENNIENSNNLKHDNNFEIFDEVKLKFEEDTSSKKLSVLEKERKLNKKDNTTKFIKQNTKQDFENLTEEGKKQTNLLITKRDCIIDQIDKNEMENGIFKNSMQNQIDQLNRIFEEMNNSKEAKVIIKAYRSKLKTKFYKIYESNSEFYKEKNKFKIFHKCNFPGCSRTFASAGWLKSHFNEHFEQIKKNKFNHEFEKSLIKCKHLTLLN